MYPFLRTILSFFLAGILLTPTVIKGIHHHEEPRHCDARQEKHLHNHEEACSICQFEFAQFISDYSYQSDHAIVSFRKIADGTVQDYPIKDSFDLFNFRAPPTLMSFSIPGC